MAPKQLPLCKVSCWTYPMFLFPFVFLYCKERHIALLRPLLQVEQPPIVPEESLDSMHVFVSHVGSSSIWIYEVKRKGLFIDFIEQLLEEHVPLEPLDSKPIIGEIYAIQQCDGTKQVILVSTTRAFCGQNSICSHRDKSLSATVSTGTTRYSTYRLSTLGTLVSSRWKQAVTVLTCTWPSLQVYSIPRQQSLNQQRSLWP